MKISMLALVLAIRISGVAQTVSDARPPVSPMKYSWKTPVAKQGQQIASSSIIEGSAHDFAYLAVDACSLLPSRHKTALDVPRDEEYLLILKSGILNISFGDSSWSIGPGSIALLLPGERFVVQSATHSPCNYYLMRYRSKDAADLGRARASGGSFVRDWNKLNFRAHDRGGVRSYFQKATAMSRRFEMHVTTLKPGLKSHDPHTHNAEEIILMLEDTGDGKGHTEMLIGDKSFQGHAGDLYYVGTNLLHGIRNMGSTTCSYFAFQFE